MASSVRLAGQWQSSFSGDGGAATAASLNDPTGVAMDAAANLYIADQLNNRIRRVNSSGIITTVAGNGGQGFSGDGGGATAARLSAPYGVAVDGSGNLYMLNGQITCIRKVNTAASSVQWQAMAMLISAEMAGRPPQLVCIIPRV